MTLAIYNDVNGARVIMLSKISQSEEGNYQMISLICGISERKQLDIEEKKKKGEREANCKRILTIENKPRVDGREVGMGMG